jgi:hypothetical protein
MLDISCTPEQALCDGKFYQLSSSLTGLSIDLEKLDQDAHCGPTGKCAGEIDVQVAIYNFKKGTILECFLEEAPKSKSKHTCSSKVSGDYANCTLPMPKELPAGDKLEGWCRLVDTSSDSNSTKAVVEATRLTHDAPFYIYNHHKAIEPPKKFAEAPVSKLAAEPPKSSAFSLHGTAALLMTTAAALQL